MRALNQAKFGGICKKCAPRRGYAIFPEKMLKNYIIV